MPSIDTLVIGAGPAGLAVSHLLNDAAVDHVVLERGRVADRWRTERWDSLQLLSPNWATRLPGWRYDGDDPSGYMTAAETVSYFERYAVSFDAPVREEVTVEHLRPGPGGFLVGTTDGTWQARNVVMATGWCDLPFIPPAARELSPVVAQVTPTSYRNPEQLPAGGVLVVGASASGVQIADELIRAGRDVVLAVGRHSRLLRRYRGMDIWWWLDRIGRFDKTIDEVPDPEQARSEGSIQLIGRPDHRDVDVGTLQTLGVRLAGRLRRVAGSQVEFAPDLAATTSASDSRLNHTLADIDRHIVAAGLEAEVTAPERPTPLRDTTGVDQLDLTGAGISTVVWATGFRRSYPWLDVPVLDGAGEIRHRRGVTPVPGLYVLGQRFQHRRDSNFIDGVRHDAAYVAHHLAAAPTRRRRDGFAPLTWKTVTSA